MRHDEFREMGQFMAMDEKPVLIDVRDSGTCRGTGWKMDLGKRSGGS
ncbi:MAG: hypothetical protein KAU52_03205 [Methanosarcinales archaeon]|nr:hypothetical protein [Methanosarcinales archaeon]